VLQASPEAQDPVSDSLVILIGKVSAVATCCLLVLCSPGVAFGQSRFSAPREETADRDTIAVPDTNEALFSAIKDLKVQKRNPDGSVTLSDGKTVVYPDKSVVFERGGQRYIRTADGKITKIATPPAPVIMRKDPVTGAERYYRVGPGNTAAEIKFPGDAGSKDRDHQRRQASDSPAASGTGFLISANGYLLTNYHLVDSSRKIVVHISGSERPAKVVKIDPGNDLALLKIDGSFAAIPLGDARAVAVGDSVMTIGYPNIQVQVKLANWIPRRFSTVSN